MQTTITSESENVKGTDHLEDLSIDGKSTERIFEAFWDVDQVYLMVRFVMTVMSLRVP